MTKLQLAQKRNYFKFVLTGMIKPIDYNVLTKEEIDGWEEIRKLRISMINKFDDNSRLKGLNVPEHRCWCGKEGKYDPIGYPEYTNPRFTKVCKKHLKYN